MPEGDRSATFEELLTHIAHGDAAIGPDAAALGAALTDLFTESEGGGTGHRLRALGANLPFVIWRVDASDEIVECFGLGMRRLGLDDGAIDGAHISIWGEAGVAHVQRAKAGEAVEFQSEGVYDGREWAMRNFVAPAPDGGVVALSIDVTESHQATAALGAVEGSLATLAAEVPVGIFLADAAGANIFTNVELQRQFGRAESELLGLDWMQYVHADDRNTVDRRFAGEHERGRRYEEEYRIILPDGTERWLSVRATRVLNGAGDRLGYVGTCEDITDERAGHIQLVASEQRFRTIAEAAPIGIFLSGRDPELVYTNPHFDAIVGRKPGDHHEAWVERVVAEDHHVIEAAAESLLDDGATLDLKVRLARDDGSICWVHAHAVALHDTTGEVVGSLGTLMDITDAMESAGRVSESEELTRAIVETAAEGIVTVDVDGRIETFNAAAQRIFRRELADAVGERLDVLFEEPHGDVYLGYLQSFRESGESNLAGSPTREVTGMRGDGRTVPVEVAFTEVTFTGGTRFTALVRDISERKEFERKLEHQATHDPLTSLPNRALLAAQLESALARAYRSHSSVAVLFISLDRIKVVTDSLGHRAGDELRVSAAHRIQGLVRPTDTVTRFGEDEFVILAEGLEDLTDAVQLARRAIDALDEPFDLTIDEAYISCNVGISYAVEGLGTAESLIADADLAMFRAKEKGGNRFEIFDHEMRAWINERRKTEVALRHALERDEFLLHYQPIVEVDGRRLKGFEALVRWERPIEGMVSPGYFIPVAEDSGLIIPIGEWILEDACSQLARWQRLRGADDDLTVSVNLSGRQLAQRGIADVVQRVLNETGANSSGLVIEITETVLLDDEEQAVKTLGELKDIGVSLAIDDFGTGYSSLTYLRRFPIDIVKIDQSFVSKLGIDSRDASIVDTVIRLAQGLDLSVVAEGVETADQLAALETMSCSHAQGYYFSRPLPVDKLDPFLDGSGVEPVG